MFASLAKLVIPKSRTARERNWISVYRYKVIVLVLVL